MLRATIGALVGGAVGAVVWTLVSYRLEVEVGWIAWGVGALAGLGAKLGAGREASPATGLLAALVALVSVLGARYATLALFAERHLADDAPASAEDLALFSDELALSYFADDEAAARSERGEALAWPGGAPPELPDSEADYPPEVWAAAAARWAELDAAQREQFKRETLSWEREALRGRQGELVQQAFLESFSPIDLLFAFLAIATAWRVGAGRARVGQT